jgi:hypothetical protein
VTGVIVLAAFAVKKLAAAQSDPGASLSLSLSLSLSKPNIKIFSGCECPAPTSKGAWITIVVMSSL